MNGEPCILVLTHPFDPTADYVVEELNRRAVPVFRCDPGQFPQHLRLAARLDLDGMTGTLQYGRRVLDLTSVGCVYYRRPTAFELPEGMSEEEEQWAAAEARSGFGGVVSVLPRWLNHPLDMAHASYKPAQLAVARSCGLTVVPTIVTNDPDTARRFVAEVGRAVYKPMAGTGIAEPDGYRVLYTSVIDQPPDDPSIAYTAHLFQQWIPKQFEVRLTVVDGGPFAVRIDAGSAATYVDGGPNTTTCPTSSSRHLDWFKIRSKH